MENDGCDVDVWNLFIVSDGPDSLPFSFYLRQTPPTSLPSPLFTHERVLTNLSPNLMLGKRGRPTFRRTTSMTGINFDVGITDAPPPMPPAMIGGEFNGYDVLSPRYLRKSCSVDAPHDVETADFLRRCGLCNRRLIAGRDIYMYRGDTAFCSLECREQQMKQDDKKERRAAAKNGENHRPEPSAAAVPEGETVAAA